MLLLFFLNYTLLSGRSTQYSYYCYFSVLCLLSGQEYSFFTELCADLRAGVLNIHITVIFTLLCAALSVGVLNIHITAFCFTELWAALRAGVLNIHITVNFTELCAAFRAGVLNFHITVIFRVLCLLSGQEYSIFISLLFLGYYACSQDRSTQY